MFRSKESQENSYGARQLLRLLQLVALVGVIFLVVMTTVGFRHIQSYQAFQLAEEEASWLCASLLREEANQFFRQDSNGEYSLGIAPEQIPALSRSILTFLRPLDIHKVVIYALDGNIVFSTEPAVLAHDAPPTEVLDVVSRGELHTRVYEAPENHDIAGGSYADRDLIETYVPIKSPGGNVVGVFEIYRDMNRYSGAFAQVFMQASALVGGLVLLVIGCSVLILRCGFRELTRAQEELHRLATRDALTGVLSRREIVNRATVELSRVHRLFPGDPDFDMSVILLDLDHFKQVNDGYGHPAGDAVLKSVAESIADVIRDFDSVGRYGGEEFLVLLPGTGRKGAYLAAERIREAISSKVVMYGSNCLRVTASLGVSSCRGQEDSSIQSLLKRADTRLYEAKAKGRNCTVCRPSTPPAEESVYLASLSL